MIRMVGISFGFLLAMSLAVAAQAPDGEHGRFTFKDVPEGLLRLDNRTGQVSVCAKRSLGWACEAAADDRTALENEIVRLQSDTAKLKRELISRGLPLPDGMQGEARSSKSDDLKLPSDADLDRVMTFLDKVWRRLVDLLQTLQRDKDPERKDMRHRETDRKEMNGAPLQLAAPRSS
jgi:hypothetical protein